MHEQQQWYTREANYERLAAEAAARSAYRCDACGTSDGMIPCERWRVLLYEALDGYYRGPRSDALYYPCWQCCGSAVPGGYTALSEAETALWLLGPLGLKW